MVELNEVDHIDLDIDGTDEIDGQLQLIKGGGGALLLEKMVAATSKQVIIIADHSKLKSQLGTFSLPVEVVPYGWKIVRQQIQQIWSVNSSLRMKNDHPFLTDNGHYILDCQFGNITDPSQINIALHLIPGVVETGLFIDMCHIAIIGYPDGSIKRLTKYQQS
jgi:ribose 5-phosphate isomerase A